MKANALFDVGGLATIVTGGASGIGLAYAEAMADNGARVALFDIDRTRLDQSVAQLKANGGDVHARQVDVTDRTALCGAVDAVADMFGRVDVLFANAGIDFRPGLPVDVRDTNRRKRVRECIRRALGPRHRRQPHIGFYVD